MNIPAASLSVNRKVKNHDAESIEFPKLSSRLVAINDNTRALLLSRKQKSGFVLLA